MHGPGRKERWERPRLATKKECENSLAVNLKVMSEQWKAAADARIEKVDTGSDWMNVTLRAVDGVSSGWTTTYLCLPDTVDPRGPKGKYW